MRKLGLSVGVIAGILSVGFPVNSANASSVTLAQATSIVDAALKKARELKQMPQTVVVLDAGGHVVIPAIDAPQSKFKNPEQAVKLSLDQEVKVTHQINALVELARSENDYITINFLLKIFFQIHSRHGGKHYKVKIQGKHAKTNAC